jgi:hypothetical protein
MHGIAGPFFVGPNGRTTWGPRALCVRGARSREAAECLVNNRGPRDA